MFTYFYQGVPQNLYLEKCRLSTHLCQTGLCSLEKLLDQYNQLSGQSTTKTQLAFICEQLDKIEKRVHALEEDNDYVHTSLKTMQDRVLFTDWDYSKSDCDYAVQSTNEVEQSVQEHEVVAFADNLEGTTDGMTGVMDEVVENIDASFQLGEFLRRPVRIASYSIPLGEAYNLRTLKPWNAFLNKTSIKSKLDNYAYIQCDLKIKVIVNSTPFIYGMYATSYRPLTTFGSQHDITIGGLSNNDRTILTQRPTIYMESHKNKGGELTLPFFYHKNWLPLTDADTQDMGSLDTYPISGFQSANSTATGPVTVLIYAWAENVKLAGNTVNLAIQARDEYGMGPVSRIASTVGGYSRHLEDIPIIGRFAKATTLGAGAIGAIASLFGFTNVPVIDNVQPLKNQPFHGFASSQIGVPMEKLTLDPKNELTVDPSTAGLASEDELAINHIAKRPALVRVVLWRPSDTTDTSLFRANVTPTWCRTIGSAPAQYYVDLPMGHISRLFSNWRGDIVVRVVIIKSQYHQGRLRVTYDPAGDIFSNADSETTTITKVVDIETTDYLEFKIPYMQPQSWLRLIPNITRDTSGPGDSDNPYNPDYHNGRFEIRVLNTLTAPAATADVNLAIYAYAADNFELANPSDFQTTTSVFQVQSSDESYEQYEMGKCVERPSNLLSVNFGEDIRSMRSLMRRTSLHMVEGSRTNLTAGISTTYFILTQFKKNLYPLFYGYDPNSDYTLVGTVGANKPGNKCFDTPYTFMAPLFVGQRGSMHYSYNNISQDSFTNYLVQRHNEPFSSTGVVNATVEFNSTAVMPNTITNFYAGITGQALENERTQTGLQFTVPFMNKFRFCSTSPADRTAGADYDDTENNNYVVSMLRTQHVSTGDHIKYGGVVAQYHSIGVDYTPLWFLSTTKRWIYTAAAT